MTKPTQPKNEVKKREFKLLQAGGSGGVELSHGVILEVCNVGCSTYRVQRIHRYLTPNCDEEESGSGS
jgi:hypothetical protein